MEATVLTLHMHRDRNDPEWIQWRVTRSHWVTGGRGLSGTVAEGSCHSPERQTALAALTDNLPTIHRQLLELLDQA